ncbi:ricin-type beta-trefoil lectin domain protein [Saccharothrix sp. Mg75]|uniref:ricin-type beta-trefoil lectin domain protein n=1 Tax=Saccharothrix sp. Mg75 TaxID=3445357 RepID=UPI003EECCFF5
MSVRPILAAAAAVCSALLVAPTAHAARTDTDVKADRVVIESANGSEEVWQQTLWDGEPTIVETFRATPNQFWFVRGDGTIRNHDNGLCATSVDGSRVAGRDCDGHADQRWVIRGSGNSRLLENEADETCATYDGQERQLRLRGCDPYDRDQRWYLNY